MHASQAHERQSVPSGPLRLRSDLVVSRHESQGTRAFVLKDPANGRFFRFREIEFFIAQRLDGATSLDVVREAVHQQFGSPLAPAMLEQFTEKLRELGLLEVENRPPQASSRRHKRIGGNIFYFRFKVFDPDRFLDRLAHRLWFGFTPTFLMCSSALILLALGTIMLNWGDIGRDFLRLYRFQMLFLAWVTVVCVTTAHELAHGVTCKRFGGAVHDMGFLLVYFQPAFYCNVSDAWMFPEKAQRLWVTFAGAYCEMVLWAIATLVWRATDPGSNVNSVALVVAGTSAIKTLFNINPLIKLDGYYMLSDYLEIPNLRQKAFRYLRSTAKTFLGSTGERAPVVTGRERSIYLVYGLVAAVYSVWLSGYIALWFGGFLIDRYQGWGLLIFTALLAAIFRRQLRDGFAKLAFVVGLRHEKVRTPVKAAKVLSQDRPNDEQPAMDRGPRHLLQTLAKAFAVCAVLAALVFGRMELTIAGEFRIRPEHNTDVRAEVEGIIEEIYVDEGQQVNKGDLIARLADRDYEAELRAINAQIDEEQAHLRLLKAGPRKEEIEGAKASLGKAEEHLKYARNQLERLQSASSRDLVSRKEFDEVAEAVAVRAKELKEADEKLRLVLAGSRPEEIEAAEAKLARLQAQRAHLEEQLQRVRVVSPISGIVTTPKVKEKIGRRVRKGDLIAKVHAMKIVTAEIAVPEKEISDVRVGQRVVLKARAYPSEHFDGTVTSIAPVVTKEKGTQEVFEKTVLVTTQLDNTAQLLKPDMTGHAKIYSSERRIIELLTRRLARYLRVEFWSWW